MNTKSASRADADRKVLIWDAPVRIFHWLMVLCFAGAWITAESDRWQLLHVTLGYTLAGLLMFRLLWGLIGTHHARFSSFVRGPAAIWRYLKSLMQGRPEHHAGHNPAGALAIVALLSLAALLSISGWATYQELAADWTEDLHEAAANLMLAIVVVHIGGVILGSWAHHENLVRSMISGRRLGTPDESIQRAWRGVAALMLAAVIAFWSWQWQAAPAGGLLSATPATERHASSHDEDQDDD